MIVAVALYFSVPWMFVTAVFVRGLVIGDVV